MKIGFVLGWLGFGGAERVSCNLAKWLNLKGYDVSFYLTLKPAEKEYALPNSIKKFYCHSSNKIALIQRLNNTITSDNPDVVLIMGTPLCIFGIPALLGTRTPFIVSERNAPKNHQIKLTTRILSRTLMHFADAYVFQTNGAMRCYPRSIQKRGVVIPNPIILEDLPNVYDGDRVKKVVSFGRYVQQKNFPLLIRAFQQFHQLHPDYVLHIYGDGSERDNLEKMVQENNLQTSIKLNHSTPNVLTEIQDAAIYVLSSDFEGMPNALLEAMALGIPAISTNCPSGGPADLIRDKENGLLIPVGNTDALTDAMCFLVENPKFAASISENGAQIRDLLNIDEVGKKWEDALLKAAGKRTRK